MGAHCADLANKIWGHSDLSDWPPCSSSILFPPLVPTFPRPWDHSTVAHLRFSQDYLTTRIQLQTKDKLTPLQGIKISVHRILEGRVLALLKGQSSSRFPLINVLLFAGPPGSFCFSLHSPYINKWEDYCNYFGEGAGISRTWAATHFLTFYDWPQNGLGTGEGVA